jgi:5-methylthioadenosine/S-adenosylhomocysteine deaminase
MLLSHADILLYRNNTWEVLKNGYIGVEGDTVACIGAQKPEADFGPEKDLSGCLLMAGLYNMHTHTAMTLLRGLGSGLPLDRWLQEAMFPVEAKLTAPDISVGTRLAMMEMLSSGVVSFTDMYNQSRVAVEEVARAGMKANLNRPILGFDPSEPYEKNFRVQESLAFHRDCNGAGGGRIIADFAVHAEYTSYEALVRPYAEDCKRRNARMHLHLSETRKEHGECKERYGKTPAKWFYDIGVFDNPTIAAHCVWVEPEDIELRKEKGVTCVHTPSSNMKLGSGFMPIQTLLEKGINLTIGTDGAASNNNQNLFEEIHLASVLHNGYTGDPTIVNPEELLTMATINGARAQGRADCGELAVGKKADIIAVNMDAPHLMPVHDIPALLTYSAQASDVKMTMVDGKILYENGQYYTIDYEKVKYDLKKTMDRLFH